MKCSVSGKELHKAAKLVLKAIDKRDPREGLKAVSVTNRNGHLTLRVYNCEHEGFSLECAISCNHAEDGFSVVDCKQFTSVCESFKADDCVKIEGGAYKNGLRVGSETNQMAIPGVDPMEFPDAFRFRKWHVTAKVKAETFIHAAKTALCVIALQ